MRNSQKTARSPAPRFALLALVCAALLVVALPAAAQPADGANAIGIANAQPLAERAAANYRAQARYPDHSRAVAAGGGDPVRARRTPSPHSLRPGPDAAEITVWSGEVSYEHPAVVTLYATVDSGPGQGKGEAASAAVLGEVVNQSGATVGTVDYRDDGKGADRRAGDGVHTGVFKVPAEHVPALAESFGVKVTAVMDGGATVGTIGGFLYGQPDAHLTGNYRDSVRGGNLVIEAEVEVTESGRFYLEGTIAPLAGGPGAGPVGWAQAAAELAPGTHWLELSFYGLMFHERGAAGPFRLTSVALSTTTGMPNALNDLVEDAHRTRAYPLARFTQRPFGNHGLLRAAERLETPRPNEPHGNGGG